MFFCWLPLHACKAKEASESNSSDSHSDETQTADSGEIQSWIEKLESPRYRDRAQASSELGKLGIHAIEALEKTTIEGGSESSDRSIEILKRHHSSRDGILKAAATDALRRISQDSNASQAAAAKQILDSTDDEPQKPGPKLAPQMIPVFPPLNQIFKPGNVNRRSTSITIRNGNREVKVEENGKSIRVSESQNGVEVEKNDGNGKVTKQQYKDLQEMKEKDPDGYRTFEKAVPGGGRIKNPGAKNPRQAGKGLQFQVPNFGPNIGPNIGGQNVPRMGPAIQGLPNLGHQDLHKRLLEQHLDRMEQIRRGQPRFQPSTPVPGERLPRDEKPAPESKKPMKTKEKGSLDV